MRRFAMAVGVMGALALMVGTATPAWAMVPTRGRVVEGQRVPGVALGTTRQQVLAGYGQPTFCQSTGNALCTWQLAKGAVNLAFVGASGGNPAGNGTDRVGTADWIGLPRWHTTPGVTTANALANPEAVPPAYPQAKVYRYGDGHLYEVLDTHLGIEVLWVPVTYSNQFYVDIQVFPATS